MDTVSDRRPPLAWIVFITCYPRRILTCWPQLLPQGWLMAWIRPLSIVTQAKPHSLRYDHLSPWKTEPQTSDALSSSWAGKNKTRQVFPLDRISTKLLSKQSPTLSTPYTWPKPTLKLPKPTLKINTKPPYINLGQPWTYSQSTLNQSSANRKPTRNQPVSHLRAIGSLIPCFLPFLYVFE